MVTLNVLITGSFVTAFLRMTACFSIFPIPYRVCCPKRSKITCHPERKRRIPYGDAWRSIHGILHRCAVQDDRWFLRRRPEILGMTACFWIFPRPTVGESLCGSSRAALRALTGKENGGNKLPPRRADKVRRTLSARFKLHIFVVQSITKNPACQKSPRRTFLTS